MGLRINFRKHRLVETATAVRVRAAFHGQNGDLVLGVGALDRIAGRAGVFGCETREDEDVEATARLFAPESPTRLDAIVPFGNLPAEIVIGRYHSLFVGPDTMPEVLVVTASTEDGIPMAIEHKDLPVGGVQFHPESLMSLEGDVGLKIVENAFRLGQK